MPDKSVNRKRVAILGGGFVGRALTAHLENAHDLIISSRQGRPDATGNALDPVLFDLDRPSTWQNVLHVDQVVWTFPAAKNVDQIAQALSLGRLLKEQSVPVLILASTSCYLTEQPDELVNENYPLDLSQARVCAEEQLRNQGCFVLCLAGIYGPGRDPASWLMRGLVKNAEQYINLIHISDICKIVSCWLEHPLLGLRVNASDGRHRRWHEVCEQLKMNGMFAKDSWPFVDSVRAPSSKRVDNRRLLDLLYRGPFHRYPEDGL